MAYVAAAYIVIALLMAIYVLTLVSRQRLIDDLAAASGRAEIPRVAAAPQ